MNTNKLFIYGMLILASFLIVVSTSCEEKEEDAKSSSENGEDNGKIEVVFGEMTDSRDGKTYKTVKIGKQVWMAENLAFLPEITYEDDWGNPTTPQYAVYGYEPGGGNETVEDAKAGEYYEKYDVLYNWMAALTACPPGWHLPSDDEWRELVDYLGGTRHGGSKLREDGTAHWSDPNTGATNEVGFSALPGGFRSSYGAYKDVGKHGYWWTATERDTDLAWSWTTSYNFSSINNFGLYKESGFSVRCLKD